jgi:hypothetical protein
MLLGHDEILVHRLDVVSVRKDECFVYVKPYSNDISDVLPGELTNLWEG